MCAHCSFFQKLCQSYHTFAPCPVHNFHAEVPLTVYTNMCILQSSLRDARELRIWKHYALIPRSNGVRLNVSLLHFNMNTLREQLNITSQSLEDLAKEEMRFLAAERKNLTAKQIEQRHRLATIAIKSSRFLNDQVEKLSIELPF